MKNQEMLNEEDWMRIDEASREISIERLIERLINEMERSRRTEVLVNTINEAASILKVKKGTRS